MSTEARRVAVVALTRLADSPDHVDRADAGRSLASFAELPEATAPLLALVLDADDTFVTRATAEALLRRHDSAGLGVVAAALAEADPNHADWIQTAVHDVFAVFARDRDAALRECAALTPVSGVAELTAMLTELDPILYPER